MIIDFHNHVWPDALAARALAGNIPGMGLFGDGTVSGLRAAQLGAGIDRSVCLAVANTPAQVAPANRFVGALDRSHFVPFGTVHPGLSIAENLQSLRESGLRGVKLHPIFQSYRLDDERLLLLLEALAGEYVVVVHVGSGGGSDGTLCTPAMLAEIATTFPSLSIVACHFGGFQHLDEAVETLIGLPVTLDTSWPPTLASLEPALVRDLIRRHGADRVVFASDWPTASPAAEVEAILALGLDDDETAAVLSTNAARLLQLPA